ncbi:C40 family peptidase [Neisseria dentiae]|uniref:C40 family peptidase n=1 Tax=Neisseria dentiae TaxID=194197 RepID=UPI00211CADBA|nr:C40 family peptidase [Neisseria dentiae]MCQ9325515.1 C40 family peptidase [Neisseria dentiae]
MIKLNDVVVDHINRHALECEPREMCGFVVQTESGQMFFPCVNVAPDPNEHFAVLPDDWFAAEMLGEIEAIVHSHPNGAVFLSPADRLSQVNTGLPWILYTQGRLKTFRCCPPLRGRVFEYGEYDCGALVRDAYMLAGIDLPDHGRTDLYGDAENQQLVKHIEACGFLPVSDGSLQAGDVFLTCTSGRADHAALYLGNGEMLHHAYNQLSRREPYNAFWRDFTHSVWRHPQWEPAMIQAIENDLVYSAGL